MHNAHRERRRMAHVLIVETDAARAKEYSLMLHNASRLDVQWGSGKLAAFERLKSWKPQLLLVGDELDGQSGLELTLWIRKYSNVPILVVTTNDDFDYYLKILNSGADGCIYHPVPAPLLAVQITALLRRAYRYSALVEVTPPEEATNATPANGLKSTTNTPPLPTKESNGKPSLKPAPVSNTANWPTCSVCSYMGSQEKFQTVAADGTAALRCTVCLSPAQLRYSLG